jgi:hypothetical protein
MRIGTLVCVLIGLLADVAAIVLLLAGEDASTLLIALACGAGAAAGAGILLVVKPRAITTEIAESSVRAAAVSREATDPAPTAEEPSEPLAREAQDDEALDNRPWLKLVEENVALFDELDRHRSAFDPARQEVADHVICRLQEILERCGVESISCDGGFDRSRHQPDGAARVLPGARVTRTLSSGFRVGNRILRRARVEVLNPVVPEAPT